VRVITKYDITGVSPRATTEVSVGIVTKREGYYGVSVRVITEVGVRARMVSVRVITGFG
jgi:hypothetical protein